MASRFGRRNEIWRLCQEYFESTTTSKSSRSALRERMDEFLEHASREDLHDFLSSWNWDAGADRVRQVIEHPRCDAGTALKAYWLASPEYYLKFTSRDEVPDYQHDDFDLICDIERRYLDNAYKTAEMPYRPKRRKPEPDWQRSLPEKMYESVGKQPWWAFWR